MTSLPLEANAAATLAEWHGLIARRDLSGLPRLLHPDAVFRSPMAHKPYAGAPVVSMILNTVLTVFEDFAITASWPAPTAAAWCWNSAHGSANAN